MSRTRLANASHGTGWTLEWGAIDWTETDMALREFISNALDRHTQLKADLPQLSLVTEDKLRAKTDTTRVYVQVDDEVRKYFANLGDHFIHYSDNPERIKPGLLPKSYTNGPARVYRMGSFVCQMDASEGGSLFDYNFSNSELEIDECRNSNPYTTRAACARRLRTANKESLSLLFKSWGAGEDTFESRLDVDYILNQWSTPDPDHVAEWTGAWQVATQGAIVATGDMTRGLVEKRGKEAVVIKDQPRSRLLKRMGIPCAEDVLTESELQGRTELPATECALAAVDKAWTIVVYHTEKQKPGVLCFSEAVNPDDPQLGFQNTVGIHLRHDICTEPSNMLDKEALRYVLQWTSTDYKLREELILELLLEG